MESFFTILALVVALASLPCGFLLARRCVKNVGGRIVLTLLFGVIILVAGVIGAISGCSAMGGRMDFK